MHTGPRRPIDVLVNACATFLTANIPKTTPFPLWSAGSHGQNQEQRSTAVRNRSSGVQQSEVEADEGSGQNLRRRCQTQEQLNRA
eukprot:1140801-Rhodomonas_salina.1